MEKLAEGYGKNSHARATRIINRTQISQKLWRWFGTIDRLEKKKLQRVIAQRVWTAFGHLKHIEYLVYHAQNAIEHEGVIWTIYLKKNVC